MAEQSNPFAAAGFAPAPAQPQENNPFAGAGFVAVEQPKVEAPPASKQASLADVITSPDAVSADMPAGAAPPSMPQLADAGRKAVGFIASLGTPDGLRAALAPAPNTTYGSVVPLARDERTGLIRPAMPSLVRSLLQGGVDLAQGPGGMQVNDRGTMTLTPEATMTLSSVASSPFRVGNAPPATVPVGTLERRPLPEEALPKLLAPEMKAKFGPPDEGALVPPPQPSVAPAKTAADAKSIASAYYTKAAQDGGTLTPAFTDRLIEAAQKVAPQTEAGLVVAGETPITKLAANVQALKGKPLSFDAAQEVDEALGNLIDKEYGPKGLSKDGKHLYDLQTQFRTMIADAGPQDIEGGKAGFDALEQGRKAWAQAMKMSDLERIQTRADLTDNPATSIKSGIRTLLSNPARVRGYSEDELQALREAADRGALGSALHVFGSRLTPLVAGGIGAHGGPVGALLSAGTAHVVSGKMRDLATALQSRRLGNAMDVLGAGVPLPPSVSPLGSAMMVRPTATAVPVTPPPMPTSPLARAMVLHGFNNQAGRQ